MNKPKVVPFNPARLPQEYLSDAVENFAAAYPKHYLIPGRVFVTNEASAISTIVGSGVSVCLWDAQAGVGGANNFLLPEDSEKELNAKYGNHANRHLLHEMIAHGAEVARIQAKVFGGSEPPTTFSNSSLRWESDPSNSRPAASMAERSSFTPGTVLSLWRLSEHGQRRVHTRQIVVDSLAGISDDSSIEDGTSHLPCPR